MGSGRRNSLLLRIGLLALLAAASCSQPPGDYEFLSAGEAARDGGVYRFSAEFKDSTARYAFTLAARIVTSRVPDGTVDFDIRITAPNGETAIERITFPLDDRPGVRIALGSGSVTDFAWPWPYRRPAWQPGLWQFAVQPADPALRKVVRGVGFSYEITQ